MARHRQGRGAGPRAGGRGRGNVPVATARHRKASSTRWLKRQLNDPYVIEARQQGYRARSAFKLAQIDDRCHLLNQARSVVDLGAAPGGWTQVVRERAPQATVLAVDTKEMAPIQGAEIRQLDAFGDDAAANLHAALPSGVADLVLSDMSPSATGHSQTDHLRIMALAEAAYDLATRILAPGGHFVCKVLHGGAEKELMAELKRSFRHVRHVKPEASRKESAETYVVAQGFRSATGDPPSRSAGP